MIYLSNPILVLLNGLTYGGLLFMGASGLTLLLGLMGVVNMAHGAYYLLGALIGYYVVTTVGSWSLALLAAGVVVALLSFLVRKFLFQRVIGMGMSVTLLTIGVQMIVTDLVLWLTGGTSGLITVPDFIGRSYDLGFVSYPGTRIFILVVAALLGVFMYVLMYKTRMGQYIRAGVDNREMATALGININRVFTFIFMLSGFLVGLSGVLGGSYATFTAGTTDSYILSYSLVIIVLGGMGSIKGAAIGALIVGLVDSFSKALVPNFTPTIVFGTVILVLAFKPSGLFGKKA